MDETILKSIVAAYGSIAEPSWAFVEAGSKLPMSRFIASLRQIAEVIETTDINVDRSRVFALRINGRWICIRRSMVGPYICVSDSMGTVLGLTDLREQGMARLAEGIQNEGLRLLSLQELREPIRLGSEVVNLYEALFSGDELLS
jgi:hypothetical protein